MALRVQYYVIVAVAERRSMMTSFRLVVVVVGKIERERFFEARSELDLG